MDVVGLGEALADHTRLRILMLALQHERISAGEIAAAIGCAPSTVSHHLDRLQWAGLIERRRSGRRILVFARHDRWRLVRDAALACTASP
jgi:DNA-binding transcriptional ArsR family regulator